MVPTLVENSKYFCVLDNVYVQTYVQDSFHFNKSGHRKHTAKLNDVNQCFDLNRQIFYSLIYFH